MDFEDTFLPLLGLLCVIGFFTFICINCLNNEKEKELIYYNSEDYTVFNSCEKIYDRYYCKND